MKIFNIFGDIVSSDAEKTAFEDTTPLQVESFLKKLEKNEPVEILINSFGGDVFACLAITNIIKKCISEGHEVTANVIGIAASSASVIACSCSKVKMANNAFMMMHLPWTVTQGNQNDLQDQIKQLEQCTAALISVYKSKFNKTDEELKEMLENETWILGSQAEMFGLSCEVYETEEPLKIAAKFNNKHFKNMPKDLIMTNESDNTDNTNTIADKSVSEGVAENTEEIQTEVTAKEFFNQVNEEDDTEVTEEVVKENAEVPEIQNETVTLEECEKRVSGMQATMQKQINDKIKDFEEIKNGYENQIKEFKAQLEVKDKELAVCKKETISLKNSLDKTTKELSEKISALAEKENALATLNARVNTMPDEEILPTLEEGLKKCKNSREKVKFIESGKYRK